MQKEAIAALIDQQGGICHSTARKLVLVVPKCHGDPLVTPEGQPIKDWEGKPIEGEGLVFLNQVASGNPTLQAVHSDGNGVIIFNDLTEEQETQILDALRFKMTDFLYNDGYPNPLKQIQKALDFAATIGAVDVYDSTIGFVNKKMTTREGKPPALEGGELGNGEQIVTLAAQRDGSPVKFVILEKEGVFTGGPTAEPEHYVAGTAAILDQGADGTATIRLVRPDVFATTYQVDVMTAKDSLAQAIADRQAVKKLLENAPPIDPATINPASFSPLERSLFPQSEKQGKPVSSNPALLAQAIANRKAAEELVKNAPPIDPATIKPASFSPLERSLFPQSEKQGKPVSSNPALLAQAIADRKAAEEFVKNAPPIDPATIKPASFSPPERSFFRQSEEQGKPVSSSPAL